MMDIKEAMDYLAGNCPTVFEPICNEITRLKQENEFLKNRDDSFEESLDNTQKALNELIFNTMNGGM